MPVTDDGASGAVAAIVVVVVVLLVVVVVSGGGGATVVVVVDVVVVVEDVVVVVEDVVVVGGTVVVVVVVTTGFVFVVELTVVVVGSVVGVVVVEDGGTVVVEDDGITVGPKLFITSGEEVFLLGTVVGTVKTNDSSALYSGFFKSRSSSGGKPGLTVETCSTGASSIVVEFRSVSAVACFVTTVSLPSRATSRTCTWLSDVCVVITKLVGADELVASTALAETCGVSWFTATVKV